MENTEKIEIGDFIEIPAWETAGMVVGILLPEKGSENVQCILLQEHSESNKTRKYHLELGEYTIDK